MVAIGFCAALVAGAAQAQTSNPNGVNAPNKSTAAQKGDAQKLSKAEQTFLKDAIETDLAEIQMGQLAEQKSQDQDVKQYGQTLQQDHNQNLQQAQQLAQQYGMTPPNAPNSKQKQMQMHEEAKGNGNPLAQYAQQTVPVLQKHLQMAQSIENKGASVGSGMKNK